MPTAPSCGTGGWSGPLPGDPDNNSILTATAVYGGVEVAWSYPTINAYAVAHTLLYRGPSNDFASALLHRVVTGNTYFDKNDAAEAVTHFYWIRIVSVYGTEGDLIGPATVSVAPTVQQMLDLLTGQLDDSMLIMDLRTRIANIVTLDNSLLLEIQNRIASNVALANALAAVQTENGELTTYILNETTQRVSADSAQVAAVNAIAVGQGSNAAAIVEEAAVRLGADNALAQSITTLTARLAVDGDVGGAIIVSQNTASTALDDAATALFTANSKNKTFYQVAEPVATRVGDLWVDVGNGNRIKQWDGFNWLDVSDSRIISTAEALTLLQATVDSPESGLLTKASIGEVDTAMATAISASATASETLVASLGGQNMYIGLSPLTVPDGTLNVDGQTLKSAADGNSFSLLPGEQLTISARVWQNAASLAAGQHATLFLWSATNLGTWMTQVALTGATISPEYKTATLTLPIEANMVDVRVGLYHQGAVPNTVGEAYADRIQVERGPIATAYKVATAVDLTAVTAAIESEATTRATETTALASEIDTLTTSVGGNTTSIQTTAETVDGILGKYTVKIDVNGYVTGYGLASTLNNGIPTSEFAIVADQFSIAPVNTSNTAADGSPFFYRTADTVINGVTIPAGAYMKAAYIHEASITSAKIVDAAITTAKIGLASIVDAHISGDIKSLDYVAGSNGWKIDKNGEMELNNATFRGELQAAIGTFNGTLLAGVLDFSTYEGSSQVYGPGVYQIVVPAGRTKMRVHLYGAGGGGGGGGYYYAAGGGGSGYFYGGGGGGGSGYSSVTLDVTPGQVFNITVGAGGTAGAAGTPGQVYGTAGSAGGLTQLRNAAGTPIVTLNGGGGGGNSGASSAGAGGSAGTNGTAGGAGGVATAGSGELAVGAGGTAGYMRGGMGGASYNAGVAGGVGAIVVENYNPNAVVLQDSYQVLLNALNRQNIATI